MSELLFKSGKVQNLHRLPSSALGNPRYGFHLVLADGSALPMAGVSNAGWAYEVSDHWEGQEVRVQYKEPSNAAKPMRAELVFLAHEVIYDSPQGGAK
jgi:hypothetical protein